MDVGLWQGALLSSFAVKITRVDLTKRGSGRVLSNAHEGLPPTLVADR